MAGKCCTIFNNLFLIYLHTVLDWLRPNYSMLACCVSFDAGIAHLAATHASMIWLHKQHRITRTVPTLKYRWGCYAWRQKQSCSRLGQFFLHTVAVNILIWNKKASEMCLTYFAAFALYIATFGYDIVVYTVAYIQPVVSAAIFAFSSHINLFPPSFMHAARATRPLALITSQLLLMIIQWHPSVSAFSSGFFLYGSLSQYQNLES